MFPMDKRLVIKILHHQDFKVFKRYLIEALPLVKNHCHLITACPLKERLDDIFQNWF